MNRFIKMALFISFPVALITSYSAMGKDDVKDTAGMPRHFSTSEEAVQQGKKDLLALAGLTDAISVDVDTSKIAESSIGRAIKLLDIDFQKLIRANDHAELNELAGASKGNMTPLMLDGKVVGIIDTRKNGDVWKVSGLSNPTIKNDLQQVMKGGGKLSAGKMTYYEVPNIQARIYALFTDGDTRYFTDYDIFSFDKPVSVAKLMPKLREDARRFDELYGDILKEKRLVR